MYQLKTTTRSFKPLIATSLSCLLCFSLEAQNWTAGSEITSNTTIQGISNETKLTDSSIDTNVSAGIAIKADTTPLTITVSGENTFGNFNDSLNPSTKTIKDTSVGIFVGKNNQGSGGKVSFQNQTQNNQTSSIAFKQGVLVDGSKQSYILKNSLTGGELVFDNVNLIVGKGLSYKELSAGIINTAIDRSAQDSKYDFGEKTILKSSLATGKWSGMALESSADIGGNLVLESNSSEMIGISLNKLSSINMKLKINTPATITLQNPSQTPLNNAKQIGIANLSNTSGAELVLLQGSSLVFDLKRQSNESIGISSNGNFRIKQGENSTDTYNLMHFKFSANPLGTIKVIDNHSTLTFEKNISLASTASETLGVKPTEAIFGLYNSVANAQFAFGRETSFNLVGKDGGNKDVVGIVLGANAVFTGSLSQSLQAGAQGSAYGLSVSSNNAELRLQQDASITLELGASDSSTQVSGIYLANTHGLDLKGSGKIIIQKAPSNSSSNFYVINNCNVSKDATLNLTLQDGVRIVAGDGGENLLFDYGIYQNLLDGKYDFGSQTKIIASSKRSFVGLSVAKSASIKGTLQVSGSSQDVSGINSSIKLKNSKDQVLTFENPTTLEVKSSHSATGISIDANRELTIKNGKSLSFQIGKETATEAIGLKIRSGNFYVDELDFASSSIGNTTHTSTSIGISSQKSEASSIATNTLSGQYNFAEDAFGFKSEGGEAIVLDNTTHLIFEAGSTLSLKPKTSSTKVIEPKNYAIYNANTSGSAKYHFGLSTSFSAKNSATLNLPEYYGLILAGDASTKGLFKIDNALGNASGIVLKENAKRTLEILDGGMELQVSSAGKSSGIFVSSSQNFELKGGELKIGVLSTSSEKKDQYVIENSGVVNVVNGASILVGDNQSNGLKYGIYSNTAGVSYQFGSEANSKTQLNLGVSGRSSEAYYGLVLKSSARTSGNLEVQNLSGESIGVLADGGNLGGGLNLKVSAKTGSQVVGLQVSSGKNFEVSDGEIKVTLSGTTLKVLDNQGNKTSFASTAYLTAQDSEVPKLAGIEKVSYGILNDATQAQYCFGHQTQFDIGGDTKHSAGVILMKNATFGGTLIQNITSKTRNNAYGISSNASNLALNFSNEAIVKLNFVNEGNVSGIYLEDSKDLILDGAGKIILKASKMDSLRVIDNLNTDQTHQLTIKNGAQIITGTSSGGMYAILHSLNGGFYHFGGSATTPHIGTSIEANNVDFVGAVFEESASVSGGLGVTSTKGTITGIELRNSASLSLKNSANSYEDFLMSIQSNSSAIALQSSGNNVIELGNGTEKTFALQIKANDSIGIKNFQTLQVNGQGKIKLTISQEKIPQALTAIDNLGSFTLGAKTSMIVGEDSNVPTLSYGIYQGIADTTYHFGQTILQSEAQGDKKYIGFLVNDNAKAEGVLEIQSGTHPSVALSTNANGKNLTIVSTLTLQSSGDTEGIYLDNSNAFAIKGGELVTKLESGKIINNAGSGILTFSDGASLRNADSGGMGNYGIYTNREQAEFIFGSGGTKLQGSSSEYQGLVLGGDANVKGKLEVLGATEVGYGVVAINGGVRTLSISQVGEKSFELNVSSSKTAVGLYANKSVLKIDNASGLTIKVGNSTTQPYAIGVLLDDGRLEVDSFSFAENIGVSGTQKAIGFLSQQKSFLKGNYTLTSLAGGEKTWLYIKDGTLTLDSAKLSYSWSETADTILDNQGTLIFDPSSALLLGDKIVSRASNQEGVVLLGAKAISLSTGSIQFWGNSAFSAGDTSTLSLIVDEEKKIDFGLTGNPIAQKAFDVGASGKINLEMKKGSSLNFNTFDGGKIEELNGDSALINLAGKSEFRGDGIQGFRSLEIKNFSIQGSTFVVYADSNVVGTNEKLSAYDKTKQVIKQNGSSNSYVGGSDRLIIGENILKPKLQDTFSNNTLKVALSSKEKPKEATYVVLAEVRGETKEKFIFNNLETSKSSQEEETYTHDGFVNSFVKISREDVGDTAYYYTNLAKVKHKVNSDFIAPTIASLSTNYNLMSGNFNSLSKRLGDLKDSPSQGVWSRIFAGKAQADFGIKAVSEYLTFQAGYDYGVDLSDATNYIGLAVSYTRSKTNQALANYQIDPIGKFQSGINSALTNGVELALYNSYIGSSGLYSDTIIKGGYYCSDSDMALSLKTYAIKNFAFNLSEEVGYKFALGHHQEWLITPQVQVGLAYMNKSHLDQYRNQFILSSLMDAIITLRNKIGVQWGYSFNHLSKSSNFASSIYLGTSYEYDYINGGDVTFSVNPQIFQNSQGIRSNGRFVTNLGGNLAYKSVNLYFDFEKSFGDRLFKEYQINFGVRYRFGDKTREIKEEIKEGEEFLDEIPQSLPSEDLEMFDQQPISEGGEE